MKRLLILFFLLAIISKVYSKQVLFGSDNGNFFFRRDYHEQVKIITSEDFFQNVINKKDEDKFVKRVLKSSKMNQRHEVYEQFYNGIKVEGSGLVLHFVNDSLVSAHGNYIPIEYLNTKPSISEADAVEVLAKYEGISSQVPDYKCHLIILPSKDSVNPQNSAKLAYSVSIPFAKEEGLIDAHTGEILLVGPTMQSSSSTGTFATFYSGTQQSMTQYYGGAYHLVDSTRNAVIHTWNLNCSNSLSNKTELSDNDNVWTYNEHASNYHYIALDIHWGFQKVYDFLYNEYNRNSYDDNGSDIISYINYLGEDNAYWNNTYQSFFFTSSYSVFKPLASIDVIAHEFGHGISFANNGWGSTSFLYTLTSNQKYEIEGCNEGLSDIWAVLIESNIKGSSGKWKFGEDCSKGGKSCLRNIASPSDINAYTQIAETYNGNLYNSSDPHIRGGVFSRWFYLLVNGGSNINELGNSYTVNGIGFDAAESIIVNAIFEGYLYHTKSFAEIRAALSEYAKDNGDYYYAQQIENAWYAVGVGSNPGLINISGSDMICSQDIYTINNIVSGASVALNTSFSSSGFSILVSSNLSIVSYSNGSLTIQKVSDGKGYIKIYYKGYLAASKEIWVGAPVINDVYYMGGNIYIDTDYEAGTDPRFCYIIINGIRYRLLGGMGVIPLSNGTYNVEAYVSNQCGESSHYFGQITITGSGLYSVGSISNNNQVTIENAGNIDSSQPIETSGAMTGKGATTVPYTLSNAQTGEVAAKGEMPIEGGVLDFGSVLGGLYVLTLMPQGSEPETFKLQLK